MENRITLNIFSWREENYFRSLGYYPFMTLLTKETAQVLLDTVSHTALMEISEVADFCEELADQLEHDQPPFIFMPNQEAIRILLPIVEHSDDIGLFSISGKWLDQLRWLDRKKRIEKS